MNEILLLSNPAKRRGSRKRRSAAQRAATRKMLAANRARSNPSPKRRRKSRKARAVSAAPVIRRRHAARKSHRRSVRRFSHGMGSGIVSMLKTGAIAGGGAVVADVGMGLVAKFAPTMTSLTSRTNADGSVNYGYYATKAALIYGMHRYGGRVTRHASTMAAGALAVMGYELIRGMLPTDGSIPLGYFNPGRIVTGGNLGRVGGVGRIMPLSGVGRIMSVPTGAGKGAVASATIRNMNGVTAPTDFVRIPSGGTRDFSR